MWNLNFLGGTVSDRLQEVYKPILSTSQCSSDLGTLFNSTGMLCAGFDAGGAGPCFVSNQARIIIMIYYMLF